MSSLPVSNSSRSSYLNIRFTIGRKDIECLLVLTNSEHSSKRFKCYSIVSAPLRFPIVKCLRNFRAHLRFLSFRDWCRLYKDNHYHLNFNIEFSASSSFTPFTYLPFLLNLVYFSIMRAVFAAFCVVGVLAAVASAGPLSREKRLAGVFTAAGTNPFGAFAGNPYGGAFAGNPYGGAFAGNPYGGVFAGNPFLSGFGFGSSGVNRAPVYPAFPDPFVPFVIPTFQFPEFKNWYEGENVCKEEKLMNTQLPDDVIPDDWKDDMPNVNTDFSHEQESCKGTDKKYVCVKRIIGNNGEAQVKATKYECCHGFVRDPTGAPGCVESKQPNPTGATQGANSKLTSNDPTYYVYTGNKMQGGSSSSMSKSSSGNIDKVPIQ